MEKINKEIGKIIANLRQEQNLSQEEFAELAQIHRTYVSQIERGLKSPTINILVKISKALKINLSEIIVELEKNKK